MAKYDRLGTYLQSQHSARVVLSFAAIEEIIGEELPKSARKHRPWWANERDTGGSRHVQARSWMNAGYLVENVDLKAGAVGFRRGAGARGL